MTGDSHTSRHAGFAALALTYLGLLALTVLTVLLAHVDFARLGAHLGAWNIVCAMAVAAAKAGLVAAIFMGLRGDRPLNTVVLVGSGLFLFLFFALTASDYLYRHVADPWEVREIPFDSPVDKAQPAGAESAP